MLDLTGIFVFLGVTSACITIILCFCIYFGVSFKWRDHEVNFTPGKKENNNNPKLKEIENKIDILENKVDDLRLQDNEDINKKKK